MKLLRLGAIRASSGAAPKPAEWIAGGDTITLGAAVGIDTSGASSVTIDGQTFDAVLVTLPDGTAANELTQIVTAGGGEAVLSGHIEGDAAGQARVSLPDVIVFALWDHAAGTHRIRTASGGGGGDASPQDDVRVWATGNTSMSVRAELAGPPVVNAYFNVKSGGDPEVDPDSADGYMHWDLAVGLIPTLYSQPVADRGYYAEGMVVVHGLAIYEAKAGGDYTQLPSGATDANWEKGAGGTGDTGPAGATGATGATGPAGADGADGAAGTDGTDGTHYLGIESYTGAQTSIDADFGKLVLGDGDVTLHNTGSEMVGRRVDVINRTGGDIAFLAGANVTLDGDATIQASKAASAIVLTATGSATTYLLLGTVA